ncbi:hypothetical protein D3C76_952400 [compost metagenome]
MSFLSGMGGAAKRGLNRVTASWLDAADQSIFFGARSGRETLVGGVQTAKDMMKMRKLSAEKMNTEIESLKTSLEAHRPKAGASDEALKEFAEREAITKQKIKDERAKHREVWGIIGGAGMDASVDSAKAIGGYFAGADRAGQGWGRTRAVATRAGMVAGTGMAVGTGMRYASGGSFTENRKGERDIAGIPFV